VMTVPDDVDDDEELARRCDKRDTRGGAVRWKAFIRTKVPLEISHDRVKYCDPWAAIANDPRRTLVFLVAGEVRVAIENARVVPDKPPEEHALVGVYVTGVQGTAIETKAELEAVGAFKELVDVAMRLAELARAA